MKPNKLLRGFEKCLMMSSRYCPECGGSMFYDAPMKKFVCRGCGLYVSREQIDTIKDKVRVTDDSKTKRRREQSEYLDWWLSKKK
jgi:transcription initiation factor TFIIIB Brf1 subunit/transcription initiation factor TFIIB